MIENEPVGADDLTDLLLVNLKARTTPLRPTNKSPARSTAMPQGILLVLLTVVMIPAGFTMRIRELLESAINILPLLSTATLCGIFSSALMPSPPSPE